MTPRCRFQHVAEEHITLAAAERSTAKRLLLLLKCDLSEAVSTCKIKSAENK